MLNKIKKIISKQLNCKKNKINLNTNLKTDLRADSLDLFELIISIEDEYSIKIPSKKFKDLLIVKNIINYIKNNYKKQQNKKKHRAKGIKNEN